MLTRSRCCLIGVLTSHAIVLLGITASLCLYLHTYADVVVQDMITDMRLIHLPHSPVFCESLTVKAHVERENASLYRTLALFDAWTVAPEHVDKLNVTRAARHVNGRNILLGFPLDYYSFHWMEGSEIKMELSSEDFNDNHANSKMQGGEQTGNTPRHISQTSPVISVLAFRGSDNWLRVKGQKNDDPVVLCEELAGRVLFEHYCSLPY